MSIAAFLESRQGLAVCILSLTICFGIPSHVRAQDQTGSDEAGVKSDADEEPNDAPDDEAEKAPEKDPFEVPTDADVEQLFEFIENVKKLRGRTLQSVMKSQRAVVSGAEAIRKLDDVSEADDTRAILAKVEALRFMARFDRTARKAIQRLADELSGDARPEIAKIAKVEKFKSRIIGVASASTDEHQEMIGELREMAGDNLDREVYGLATSLARAIGYTKHTETAAQLYEELASWMRESDDEMIVARAEKTVGAARRLRLPGNFMEVMGQTTDGDPFDWAAYRGKVVLVDFWASWCGPCLGELPNMKRNLESYGDRGFAIVGINMDRTLQACQKCVEQKEISWVNLISDDEEQRGWDHPLANHYGVTGIPTAILVDQDGKVVSLRARGRELDRLLAELLGPAEEPKDEDDEDSEGPDENKASEDEGADNAGENNGENKGGEGVPQP